MDHQGTTQFNNSTDQKIKLLSIDIKPEPEDYTELINEVDVKPHCTDIKNVLDDNTNLAVNKRYSCIQCNEEFPELKYIQIHEAVHNKKLHCPVCDRIFKSEKHFVPHIETHLKNPLSCQECPEIFFDKRSYNLHSYTHKKTKTYTCEYCLKEWSNKKDMTVHIRVHTNERPYSCADCGRSFKQKGGLTSHIFTLHLGEKKVVKEKFSCDICNGSYSSVSSLNKHVRQIHGAGKTFPCRSCGETFLNFQQMKEHKKQVHPELVYARICPLCNQKFSCRETFAKHQLSHAQTGQELNQNSFATPIDCYLCGDQIHGLKAFSKHQQLHLLMTDDEVEACTRAKQFNCKVCGKRFNFKKNLFRHMDVHLEKKFDCGDHCSKKFTYLGIRLHLEWFFEQFICSECDEKFIGRKSFKKHYKKHQATIKFSCIICGYKFRYRRLLITHWKMQHNLKCHLCFKEFVTHLELRRHIKIKHKVKSEPPRPMKRVHVNTKVGVGNTRKYNCKHCKHSSDTLQLLRDHMKLHKKKCFQCENCKKNFLYFRNWMFHMRQNICCKYFDKATGKNRLSCIVCKKEFQTVQSLIMHTRCHNAIHTCDFCNSKFKEKDLQEHIKRQHSEETKYSCDKCSLSFCSQDDLCEHEKCHNTTIVKEESKNGAMELAGSIGNPLFEENDAKLDAGHSVWIKEECTNL